MKKVFIFLLCIMLLPTFSLAESAAFQHDSSVFLNETAQATLQLCAVQDEASVKAAMKAFGLNVIAQANYDKADDDISHTSAYTLAEGSMNIRGEERTVLALSIRGTDGAEWYSNFDFSASRKNDTQYSDNFLAASQAIWADVSARTADVKDPVWIICGFSRGAACANLVGTLADDQYDKKDIYVYTFATPTTMTNAEDAAKYTNIFNIINPNDLIPHMPLPAWGFTRAGTDIMLPYGEGGIDSSLHEMLICLYNITPDIASYYTVRHSLTGMGESEDGMTVYDFFVLFSDLIAGTQVQKQAAQQKLMQMMSVQNDFSPFLKYFTAVLTADENGMFKLFSQHYPTVYQSLLTLLQPAE